MTTSPDRCPVAEGFRFVGVGTLPSGFERYDQLQDGAPIWKVEDPGGSYWMVLDRGLIVTALQDPTTFSSSAINPLDPDPMFRMRPVQLDPPEHSKWRRLLASYFSPRRIQLLEERILMCCRSLLAELAPAGRCDFVTDFAMRFPTVIFLELVGLPVEELPTFLDWLSMAVLPDARGSLPRDRQMTGILDVMGRFSEAITERRAHPDPDALDIISHAASDWEIDGEPVADDDILECCLLLFLAGLDTVANELAMAFYHLATHPVDRAALVADPSVVPAAVEEFLRVYSIPQLARKVARDCEFAGQSLRTGDMVLLPLAAANRDPAALDRARQVALDRAPGPHYAFGAGPHRCLGSHLARIEMATALREWHAVLPDYELDTEEPIAEHRGSIHGLSSLPLRWPLVQ
jgi:cytochrome P450